MQREAGKGNMLKQLSKHLGVGYTRLLRVINAGQADGVLGLRLRTYFTIF